MSIVFGTPNFNTEVVRCPSCLKYLDTAKLKECPKCKRNYCYLCGFCYCDEKYNRAVEIWAKSDSSSGDVIWD